MNPLYKASRNNKLINTTKIENIITTLIEVASMANNTKPINIECINKKKPFPKVFIVEIYISDIIMPKAKLRTTEDTVKTT